MADSQKPAKKTTKKKTARSTKTKSAKPAPAHAATSSAAEAPFESDTTAMPVSVSVQGVMRELADSGDVPATTVAVTLQHLHPEYGGGEWPDFHDKDTSNRQTIERWVTTVAGLLRTEAAPRLHGRLLLIGLTIVDDDFASLLAGSDFLRKVEAEFDVPLETQLDPEAYQRWRSVAGEEPTPTPSAEPTESESVATIPDNVPTHSDHPASKDGLGRAAFARALATRLERVRRDEHWPGPGEAPTGHVWWWFLRSRFKRGWLNWWAREREVDRPHGPGGFMLHLNGPWGSGKTSLLNFIAHELSAPERKEPWIAVYFNAWRSERLGPPWWALTREIYRQSRTQLQTLAATHPDAGQRASAIWYSEVWWRALTGIGAPVLVFGLILLTLTALGASQDLSTQLKQLSEIVGNVASVVTAVGAVLMALRFLVTGSARGANALMEVSGDPMSPLIDKFSELVRLTGYPIVILIDDLDRCQFDYVSRLLQGIQTLFWRTPVAYVVAADRQWLRAAYEQQFSTYRDYVGEAGRPLGYLFLEKLFQLSANVPRLGQTSARRFWLRLLGIPPEEHARAIEQARERAQSRLQQASTEAEVLMATQEATAGGDEVYAQVMREEAVVRLAAQDIEAHTQHVLVPYLDFLEPNPRAMKRMVNAYGVRRAVDVLRGGVVDRGVLALWTILEMRWPILAEHLAEHPDEVEHIRNGKPTDLTLDEDLLALYQSPEVRRLINGEAPDVTVELDAAAIRQCTGSLGGGSPELMS